MPSRAQFSLFSRRALRPRFAAAVALAGIIVAAAACQGTQLPPPLGPPPPPRPTATPRRPRPPDQYQAASTVYAPPTPGTSSPADGGIPVPLPDGRILWLFGDTVRRAVARRAGDPCSALSNSFVVQTGRLLLRPTFQPIPNPARPLGLADRRGSCGVNAPRWSGTHALAGLARSTSSVSCRWFVVSVLASRAQSSQAPSQGVPKPEQAPTLRRAGPVDGATSICRPGQVRRRVSQSTTHAPSRAPIDSLRLRVAVLG